jgi:hypothetical protein
MPEKPIEEFSKKELDRYYGEYKDLSDEQKEFSKEFTEEFSFEGIYNLISKIMNLHYKNGTLSRAQYIVGSSQNKVAIRWAAEHFRLNFVCDARMPINEIFIAEGDKVESLILSRYLKSKGVLFVRSLDNSH